MVEDQVARPIKFRAWHMIDRKMYDMHALLFNRVNGEWLWDYVRNTLDVGYYKTPYLILMQFIGLLDKNGKEIYEDDIVRINHPHDWTGDFTNAIGHVFWSTDAGFAHTNNHGRPPKAMWDYVEVIGNIYEHPDLLPPEARYRRWKLKEQTHG